MCFVFSNTYTLFFETILWSENSRLDLFPRYIPDSCDSPTTWIFLIWFPTFHDNPFCLIVHPYLNNDKWCCPSPIADPFFLILEWYVNVTMEHLIFHIQCNSVVFLLQFLHISFLIPFWFCFLLFPFYLQSFSWTLELF